MLMLYKIIHNLMAPNLRDLLPERKYERGNYQRREADQFITPKTRAVQKSFLPVTVRKWNDLDPEVRCSTSVEDFITRKKKRNGKRLKRDTVLAQHGVKSYVVGSVLEMPT